jgi:predicted transcriptional regulator
MSKRSIEQLSRRERQIMNIVFREREVTVSQVRNGLPDPPSYSAVRALLRVLEDKGYLKHRQQGRAYLYFAAVSRKSARRVALRQMVQNFFGGSVESVVSSLVDESMADLSEEELDRLEKLIKEKRKSRGGK